MLMITLPIRTTMEQILIESEESVPSSDCFNLDIDMLVLMSEGYSWHLAMSKFHSSDLINFIKDASLIKYPFNMQIWGQKPLNSLERAIRGL